MEATEIYPHGGIFEGSRKDILYSFSIDNTYIIISKTSYLVHIVAMIQKVDSSASGHLQNQELCSVIQAKLDGKSPYFYANQKHCKTKRVANCVHAGLRF